MTDLFEQVFGFWVVRVCIGVQFTSAFAIRTFDFVCTGSAIYLQ
jgi:hypothetical protein